MSNTVDFSGKPFHFIGIGGIGMSALAYVLAKRQLPVSGSDICTSHITQRLQSVGARIFSTQEAANLEIFLPTPEAVNTTLPAAVGGSPTPRGGVETSHASSEQVSACLPQVIASTAISDTNCEYEAALKKGCPIFHRSDLLAALIQDYPTSVAIAGTHGKTTTSSAIGHLFLKAGLDPTVIVGGEVDAWGGNARLGHRGILVAEADESDGSLSKLSASIGVVTNVELDHPDHYQTLESVISTFTTFATQCNTLVGCIDDDTVREQLQPSISYSLQPEREADYTVKNVTYQAWGTRAEVVERGKVLGEMQLQLLGQHNLSNAIATVAVGRHLGLDFPVIAEAITSFEGTKRRFEHRGECNGVVFVDDYAHHPSEISATLAAARLRASHTSPRIVAIFQPHRYSRTQTFLEKFATAFSDADVVVITEIYGAGEAHSNISGQQVADAIAATHPNVLYHPDLSSLSSLLTEDILQPADLALFLGAGNLNRIIPEAIALLESRGEAPKGGRMN
ncbi:MAG: UDP-N-acetylmuramate--L-alanine ligase [Cyanobacteria bacterium SW_4_48_29]|jgi:UDP-N-acetylmuramate--alanine ligase|nr:MAG: UDP-N-acetylmuramate--L-alanine ligase [Cyanobacteria bacterium QH_10_48_56]PSO80107.1 MAG: UDP-N-acetylmuramate--L-alanine ligase [Cyanobacteria bacterium QS_5_48_63]PSO82632.1 MAG: UDP-N-acetylmuramate--L-alanine ligase [Cyanobacteria bacterium QS_4_48_99]PSO92915.1 MAG: UDP-N-acetylmuramate--L-alanine ligase [Cyanobacteria bacterium QS_6_48_18]PSP07040.1 MAG: UDP-N-acetylmuramate--L-alanine ligase [Cyanobacteria bacterium SW_7_48_12]PSP11551.1 MAG: UDP-N-acetylmuramate--L-alanine li